VRLLAFAAASFLSAACAPAAAQLVDGFLGYRWGTPLGEIESVLPLSAGRDQGGSKIYSADFPLVEGMALSECELEFIDDRLAGACFTLLGRENARRFVAFLDRQFGHGRWEGPHAVQWFGPESHIAYDEDEAGNAYVYWYSLKRFSSKNAAP
jgi:hypothetical protein